MIEVALIVSLVFILIGLLSFFENNDHLVLLIKSQFFFLGLFLLLTLVSVCNIKVDHFGHFIFLYFIFWAMGFLYSLICLYLDLAPEIKE